MSNERLRARLRRLIKRRFGAQNVTVDEALAAFLAVVEDQRRSPSAADDDDAEDADEDAAADESAEDDADEGDDADDADDADDVDDGADDADGDAVATTVAHACPCCGERIPIAIDLSGDDQDAVQDCTVCCRPLRVCYTVRDGRLGTIAVDPS